MPLELHRIAPVDSAETVRSLSEELRRLVGHRDSVSQDELRDPQAIQPIVDFQREDGSFALVSSYEIPSDARVDFVYRPSYACCQMLMRALLAGNENPALRSALARGLAFCCTRRLQGHGFDALRQQLEDVRDFVAADAPRFLELHPDLCPEFTELIQHVAHDYQTRILNANTFGDWGEDHTLEMMELVGTFGLPARAKVFVYGTLLQGMYNADLIAQAPYLGKAELVGYDLYDLGAYPGIKPAADKPRKTLAPRVLGELRLADAATLRRLHALEGKGSLYDFKPADVLFNGVPQRAYVYVYRGQVDPMNIIPLQLQPYSRYAELKQTHVWYACYGSNILMERFMNYIAGGTCRFNGRDYLACSDPTPPVDVRAFTLPYGVYFGNRSISWEGSGVAFLDVSRPGEALGRAYLITREQYAHVRHLECANANWYPDEVDLGTLNGIPVRTFTNRARREPNAPSATYLDVMRAGIEEAYCPISSSEVEAYLAKIARR